ncbi:MAG: BamA/TamA family outer membrane protein [Anaeromyxobacter sp.]
MLVPLLALALVAAPAAGSAAAPAHTDPAAPTAAAAQAEARMGPEAVEAGQGGTADAQPALGVGTGTPQTLAPGLAAPRQHRWFLLPIPFYTPETRFGLAVTSGLHFGPDQAPRPSSAFASVAYTLGGQGMLDLATEGNLVGGAVLAARARAVSFPDHYYGLGPDTPSSAEEPFTRRSVELVATFEWPVPGVPGLRVGPRVDLRGEAIREREAGGALDAGTVTGWDGYTAVSLGGSITYDTRDGSFWPTRGSLLQSWYVYAPAELGRHEPFGRGVVEARHFLPLGHGRVLGFDAYAEGVHGDPPFTLLPKLGSTRFMRGIREGRYRDRLDWAAQTELRLPVKGRFSATTFAAVGDVAHGLDALTLDSLKWGAGAGLRYRLTDEGANIRLDVAASAQGVEFYALVLEAF